MTIENIHLPRRALIAGAAAATGIAALAAPARAARIAGMTGRRDLATGGLADWRAAVGTVFAAESEHGTVALRLATIEPLPASGPRPATLARDHAFAARFVPAIGPLPAGNRAYRLSGGGYAPLHVFVDAAGEGLTAIFN
jgi:hypothetical protein